MKYLALGDSYTIGEGVEYNENWPNQLAANLHQKAISFSSVEIIAKTGWTTNELLEGIAKRKLSSATFDLVSLSIGVNNQYRGYEVAQYEKEFAELLSKAVFFAQGKKGRVFVLSIPDYSITPFAQQADRAKITTEIAHYNEITKQICRQEQIAFYNITPISQQAVNNDTLLATDQLHPSAKMYAQWVAHILEKVIHQITNS